MSQKKEYTIKCPECSGEQKVELYESINLGMNPELREELMGNKINSVTCESCEFEFRVDKTLIYNDPQQHFIIYCVPEADADEEEIEDIVGAAVSQASQALPENVAPPAIHITLTRTELVERIFVLEKGLDPRIIEYIKYTIFTRNIDQINPEVKTLLFDAEDSNEDHLLFVVQDVETQKLETVLQYARKGYAALETMFDQDEETANLLELFPGPYISARKAFNEENSQVLEQDEDDLFS